MPKIKTAISIEEPLFNRVNSLAQQLYISSSHLISVAVQEFIQRHDNRELFELINKAYNDSQESETNHVEAMRSRHNEMVKSQW